MDIDFSYFEMTDPWQIGGLIFMYVVGVFLCNIPINYIVTALNLLQNNEYFSDETKKYDWRFPKNQSSILGIIERALFITSLLFNFPQFIAFWFTVKMIVVWKSWSKKDGRLKFNNFLIGNGLSLAFSFSAFLTYEFSFIHIQNQRIIFMIVAGIAPWVLSWAIKIWMYYSYKRYHDNKDVFLNTCYLRLFQKKKTNNLNKK